MRANRITRVLLWVTVTALLSRGGTANAQPLIGVDFGEPGVGYSPPTWNNFTVPPTLTVTDLIDESGLATAVDIRYTGDFSGVDGAPVIVGTVPSHAIDLETVVSDHFYGSAPATAIFSDLTPNMPYYVWVFGGLRLPDFDNVVEITGAGTPISFVQQGTVINFDESFVNDELGTSSRTLLSYAETVFASASGTIEIGWDAGPSGPGSTWAIGGLAIQPVPEPATLTLLALGGLAVMRRRRR